MHSLRDLEGQLIYAQIFNFGRSDDYGGQEVRLLKVEEFGIWIESQEASDISLKTYGVQAMATTPVVFLPWHRVGCITSHIDVPSISTSLHES